MKIQSANRCKTAFTNDGFTFLEIMVALLIISVGIVSVIQLSRANLSGLTRADDQIESSIRAAAKMREILNLPSYRKQSWSEMDDAGYTYEVAIDEMMKERTDSLPVRMEKITLTMHWVKGKSKKQITLKTAKVSFRSDS